MKRCLAVCLAALAIAACSSNGSKSSHAPNTTTPISSATTTPHNGWDAAALATAKKLADQLRAKGVKCDGYTDLDFGAIAKDYAKTTLPVPAAMTQCTTAGGENLTFETFADQTSAYQFMGDKIALICRTAAAKKLPSPNFPYVASFTWFVEPDNQSTANRLAPLIGGIARTGACPKA